MLCTPAQARRETTQTTNHRPHQLHTQIVHATMTSLRRAAAAAAAGKESAGSAAPCNAASPQTIQFLRGAAGGGSILTPPSGMSSLAGQALFSSGAIGRGGHTPSSRSIIGDAPSGALAGVAAVETGQALRAMLAGFESGEDAVGRMLRDLKASASCATMASLHAVPPAPVAGTSPAQVTGPQAPRASAVALQVAFDQASSLEEIQSIIAQALSTEMTLNVPKVAGAPLPSTAAEVDAMLVAQARDGLRQVKEELARVRSERDAAQAELETLRSAVGNRREVDSGVATSPRPAAPVLPSGLMTVANYGDEVRLAFCDAF